MQSKVNVGTILRSPAGFGFKVQLSDYVVYICFAVVLIFFGLTIGDKGFLTVANLFNITRTTSMIAVMAVAMTFIISAGELDLSVGSIVGQIAKIRGCHVVGIAGGVAAFAA